MSSRRHRSLLCLALFLAPAALAAGPARPLAVSPGDPERAVAVATACPTFSWAAVEGAGGYEVAVLDLGRDSDPEVVLRQRIAGAALSWTPSGGDCLAPGRAYAWSVRALDSGGRALDGEEGWAGLRRFAVPAMPGPEELAAALAVLARYRAAAEGVAAGAPAAATGYRAEPAGRAVAEAAEASGVAAVRGENPASSGASYGVLGQSSSAQGAGLVAVNLTSGPDLVLDGAANASVDTLVRHDSIDRPAATQQKFDFLNSLGGGLDLRVNGTPVALEGHLHGGEEIAYGTVAEARIAASLARDGEVFSIVLAQDGSGSTLDADRLDGLDSAAFLKLSGGTMAGNLDMNGREIRNVYQLRLQPTAAAPPCNNGTIYYDSDGGTGGELCFCINGAWQILSGDGTTDCSGT